jgi:hypothetical protein
MTANTTEPKPNEPGLTQHDRKNLERLLKSGHFATAVKLYRFACRCSGAEAEQAIDSLSKRQILA